MRLKASVKAKETEIERLENTLEESLRAKDAEIAKLRKDLARRDLSQKFSQALLAEKDAENVVGDRCVVS